jgi:YVTN family beta-propeller protein
MSKRWLLRSVIAVSSVIVLIHVLLAGLAQAGHRELAPSGPANRSVATVALPNQSGLEPYAMAYNSSNGYVYVTNNTSDDVAVINGTQIIRRIPVGAGPLGVVYNPANGYIYVANQVSDTVSVINGLVKTNDVAVGHGPANLVYNPKNGYIYVGNTLSNTVTVINGASIVATVVVGNHPSVLNVIANPALPYYGDVYVSNLLSKNVSIIAGANGTTVVGTLPADVKPGDIAVNNHNGYVYVVHIRLHGATTSISTVISTARALERASCPSIPILWRSPSTRQTIVVWRSGGDNLEMMRRSSSLNGHLKAGNYPAVYANPVTHYACVSDAFEYGDGVNGAGTMPPTIIANIPVGDEPQAILIHPTNNNIYVGNRGGNSLSILQGTTNIGTILPQYYPTAIKIDPVTGYAVMAMRGGNVVRIYNRTDLVAEVPVGRSPRELVINPATGLIYVPNSDSDSVSIISRTKTIAMLKVGSMPVFAAADSAHGFIYATNWASDTVSVLSGTALIGSVPVPGNPRRAAIQLDTGLAYVVAENGNSVYLLNGASVINSLGTLNKPKAVLYNPVNHYMYISNQGGNSVSVVTGTQKVASDIPVGSQPEHMAVDASGIRSASPTTAATVCQSSVTLASSRPC